MLSIEEIGFWVNVGAGIATVVLVVIVWFQTKQTQHQLNSTLRPWIGVKDRVRFENPLTLMLTYTNYGQIPPQNIGARWVLSDREITKDDIVNSGNAQTLDLGTIMPNMLKELRAGITEEQYNSAMHGGQFHVGYVMNYEYAKNKKGEYGVIYYFDVGAGIFLIKKEWAR